MPWKPSEPGEVPTLGWIAIDWMTEYLAQPDRGEYEPFVPYREQEDFLLWFYELDPWTGKRKRRRGLLSRPRGWGKSPLLGAVSLLEGLGPVVPAGWDSAGQPVAKPWSEVRTPRIGVLAVSEDQTSNTWDPMVEMCAGPVLDAYPGLEALDTQINLGRGRIEKVTSSARTVKGAPFVFAVMDQTEEWVKGNGGHNLFEKVKNNTAKVGGSFIESPNAYIPGEDSVAERSAAYGQAIKDKRVRDDGLYYDHREAPADTDLTDRDSLLAGLRVAYGDASGHPDGCVIHDPPCKPGHVNLDILVATIWDPTSDEQESRSDFLNQITHASDAFLSRPEWVACANVLASVSDREVVTLGFDGSRGRAKGKPDATALIGCRVEDGHLFEIGVWEARDDKRGEWPTWQPPMDEIEAAVKHAFEAYEVVGFYADPAKDWRSHIDAWEAKYYNKKIKVKASQTHPFEWWMTGGRSGLIQRAVEQFAGAVQNKDLTHDGSSALTRHVLNSRRRVRHGKLGLGKESDYSPRKIDAAIAAILAWQARLDAVASGVLNQQRGRVVRRLR
jgi:hypothetical protein